MEPETTNPAPRPVRLGRWFRDRRTGLCLWAAGLLAVYGLLSPVDAMGLGTDHALDWIHSGGRVRVLRIGCATAMLLASTMPIIGIALVLSGRQRTAWILAGMGLAAALGHLFGHGITRSGFNVFAGSRFGIYALMLANVAVIATAAWHAELRLRRPWPPAWPPLLAGLVITFQTVCVWHWQDPITPALSGTAGRLTAWNVPGWKTAAGALAWYGRVHEGDRRRADAEVSAAVIASLGPQTDGDDIAWVLEFVGRYPTSLDTAQGQADLLAVLTRNGVAPEDLIADPRPGVFSLGFDYAAGYLDGEPARLRRMIEAGCRNPNPAHRLMAARWLVMKVRALYGDDLGAAIAVLRDAKIGPGALWPGAISDYPIDALLPLLQDESHTVRDLAYNALQHRCLPKLGKTYSQMLAAWRAGPQFSPAALPEMRAVQLPPFEAWIRTQLGK